MTRVNKKTRIKGLPAKLQLSQQDAMTGSYPTKLRIASDNRTGKTPLRFDDTVTQMFLPENVFYPSLLPVNSVNIDTETTSSLSVSAVPRKGVEDQYIKFTLSGAQNLQPFEDDNHPEVDGKSSNNLFYTTGSKISDAGEGFSSPLWSKTKIEIDISVTSETTYSQSFDAYQTTDGNFQMFYYSPNAKEWEGLGRGQTYPFLNSAPVELLDELYIGFAPSQMISTGAVATLANAGIPISTFGFPAHVKYHAKSTQTINVSDYISEPFLVEKVVMEISSTYEHGDETQWNSAYAAQYNISGAINTAFLLNQRKNFHVSTSIDLFSSRDEIAFGEKSGTMPILIPSRSVSTIRDLITWHNITSYNSDFITVVSHSGGGSGETSFYNTKDLFDRDSVLQSAEPKMSGVGWSEYLKLETAARVPTKNQKGLAVGAIAEEANLSLIRTEVNPLGSSFFTRNTRSGRNSLGLLQQTGRDWRTPFGSGTVFVKDFAGFTSGLRILTIDGIKNHYLNNPYIIQPGDQLVLGWQMPVPQFPSLLSGNGSWAGRITFHPGNFKMTIYGSQIVAGKEHHDTLNQETTSNVVHEIIG